MPQTTNQSLARDQRAYELRQGNLNSWASIASALGFTQESVARASARRHAQRIGDQSYAISTNRSAAGRFAALQRFSSPTIPAMQGQTFGGINTRTFGVEIEFKTARKHDVASQIALALGVPHIHSFAYHNTRCETCHELVPTTEIFSQWKVERDGSVTETRQGVEYGGEVVSPILSINGDGLKQIQKVTKALKTSGATINRKCGLHIHISVKDFSNHERANIVRMWQFQQIIMEKFVSASRINNYYCTRLQEVGTRRTVSALEQGLSATSFNSKMQQLNVLPYETPKKTFEVRLHQGTLSSIKINTWVKLLLAFFTNSAMMANQPEHGTNEFVNQQDATDFRPMLSVFAGKGLIKQREADYLTNRVQTLDRRSN